MANVDRNAEDYDQNLEVKSYFQSVRHPLSLSLTDAIRLFTTM